MSGPDQQDGRPDYSGMALAGTAVTEMVAPVLIGVWLDSQFGWSPWGLAIGAVLGFGGGIAHLMVIANRTNTRDDKKTGGTPPTGG